jgi:hypothetical protein
MLGLADSKAALALSVLLSDFLHLDNADSEKLQARANFTSLFPPPAPVFGRQQNFVPVEGPCMTPGDEPLPATMPLPSKKVSAAGRISPYCAPFRAPKITVQGVYRREFERM